MTVRYSAFDALQLVSMVDEYFHCENCNGELVARSNKLVEKEIRDGGDNAMRRQREKLKDMLHKFEVELSIREDVIYIGTLLKSLEIVDQYQFSTMALPRYLARSFIQNSNEAMSHQLSTGSYGQPNQSDSEDKFFEASDELDDVIEFPTKQNDRSFSAWASSPSLRSSMKPPSFSRISGLLPSSEITNAMTNTQNNDTIDSFVKAQLLIYSNGSPCYHHFDNRLDFSSFSENDEDYNGYDYSLTGKISEVRVVYLNRFVQEVTSYFMGLVPRNSETFVKLKDHGTNSETQLPTSEIPGSPALKLDLLLSRPIILMPQRTYLKLDAKHITVQNTYRWLGGDKNEISAVRLDIMTVKAAASSLTVVMTTTNLVIDDVEMSSPSQLE
ncbi:hypothetical protein HPP92_015357 [Vanilla planifolia]|uniref:Uncharacterized protein n=2 Tax=Vanilla planifolia TaxID=51239 RepID=A0A835UV11_VANPL|nr:hypothetical protein HPP92_015357 [Vanilla planifolia]